METRVGNEILSTDLRSILEDVKIRKVGHVGMLCRPERCPLPVDNLEFDFFLLHLLHFVRSNTFFACGEANGGPMGAACRRQWLHGSAVFASSLRGEHEHLRRRVSCIFCFFYVGTQRNGIFPARFTHKSRPSKFACFACLEQRVRDWCWINCRR